VESLKWYFQLVDQISGPIRGIQQQLAQLRGGLQQVGGQAGSAFKAAGAFGIAAQGAQMAADAARELARAVADTVWETTKFAVESASFKRNTLAGFELMEGSAEEAKKVFDQIKALADKTPFETKDVMKLFGTLRGSGFKMKEAKDILAGTFDVGAVIGGNEGRDVSQRLIEGIVKVRSEGKLTTHELRLMALSAGGKLNTDQFYKQLALMKGITAEQAKQQVHAGKVQSGEGITAILKTIQANVDKGGPLGKATEKFGVLSWEGQLSTFKSRLASLFEDINIQPLVDVMTRINELLSDSSPAGKRIRAFFNDAFGSGFGAVGKLLDGGTLTKIFDGIADVVDGLSAAFKMAWPYVTAFAEAFGASLKPVIVTVGPLLAKVFGDLGAGPNPTVIRIIQIVAEGLGDVVIVLGALLAVAGLVSAALAAFQALLSVIAFGVIKYGGDALGWLADALLSLGSSAWSAGAAFVDGLINGIRSGWTRVTDSVKSLAHGAVDTVEKALGISSPSRVMAQVGLHTAAGLSVGVRAGSPGVARAHEAMLAPLVAPLSFESPRLPPPSTSVALGGVGGGRAPISISIEIGPINLHGGNAADAESLAATLGSAIERRMVDIFERLAMEHGAAIP